MISERVAPFLEHGKARDHLIVLVHAYSGAKDRLASVRKAIRYITKNDIGANADIYTPELPFQNKRVCTDKAETIVAGLVDDIDVLVNDRLQNGGGYVTITLVGHSFGTVLARKIAIVAFGEQKDGKGYRPAPFEAKFARFPGPQLGGVDQADCPPCGHESRVVRVLGDGLEDDRLVRRAAIDRRNPLWWQANITSDSQRGAVPCANTPAMVGPDGPEVWPAS